ncbi:NTP transferase domain-containing protein [bacterium]|nr:NTP transferase domain-containing protein [bacterium]MBU1993680.1 NTP transferase domain-containing protein [bacterium]
MKAVVLAGGFGTRIQPLTNSCPKPMLPIVNKPMMEHTMVSLKNLGIKDFIILLYFKPEIIQDYFGDGSSLGINISYIIPDDDYGTAGAVKLAQEVIGDENFIIISGDLVTDFEFQKIFESHKERHSKLTITLTSVKNPLQFGVVIANEDGKIEKFLEKPSWGEVFSDTINTGIYIIEPEILDYIPKNTNYDFAKDLFPLLMKKGIDLNGYSLSGYWRDVGNPESYREVYDDILNSRVNFPFSGIKKVFPDGELYGEQQYDLDKSVEILGKVVLGENVKIGKGVKLNNVVIGNNTVIGDFCKIRNTVIWNDSVIENGVVLDSCVICNNTSIGNNTQAKAGLILAEGCEVGRLVSIDKDITIWPNKLIDNASIVSNNVIWGSKYKNSIFENGVVSGISNVELSCEMTTKLAEAFSSQLPIGSRIYVARDYHKSSRMLKRAFLGGILASGVNVVDLHTLPPSVMRYNLASNDEIVAGVHFRQHIEDPASSKIVFFNEDGLEINSSMAKNIEKAFFKEEFRRVNYKQIGEIIETHHNVNECLNYKEFIESKVDKEVLSKKQFHIIVDLMFGGTAEIFPKILNDLQINNIVLNAYADERKLGNIQSVMKRSKKEVSAIIKSLNLDIGLMIYPNNQKLTILTDKGEALEKEMALFAMLYLINKEKKQKKQKVLLPTWTPDIMDATFDNLEIERGKSSEFKASKLKEYDLIATVDGNFAFTAFTLHHDSMYAGLKMIELLIKHDLKLSDIVNQIEDFYYSYTKVPCAQALKGTMMRKFLEDAKNKESSSLDGVKIWTDKHDWILMIPDQYEDALNLYIQAKNRQSGDALHDTYRAKIEEWSK